MADFLFPGAVWFLAPKPPYATLAELAVVVRGIFEDGATGNRTPVVYAFSDRDLAERKLAADGQTDGPYAPLALPDDVALVAFLEELTAHGDKLIGADAEPSSTVVLPIPKVIAQIRRRGDSAVG